MKLWHATTRQNLDSILTHGLLVAHADPQAKLKGCWMATASNRGWAIIHTIRKHNAQLQDVVVIEVNIPRTQVKRFRTGLWVSSTDVPPVRLGQVIEGAMFGASASN